MSSPIYRTIQAPRINLIGYNTDITARGVVGVNYNDKNCIEYTTYGHKGLCDGYSVEVQKHQDFAPGTIINIVIVNISPTGPTTPVKQSYTVTSNFTWPLRFMLWADMRTGLGAGKLDITFDATTPATTTNSGGIIFISFSTIMTAAAP